MHTITPSTESGVTIRSRRLGIASFLVIAFGLSWAIWIPLWLLGISPASEVFNIGVVAGSFAPALATIITRQWVTREGFADAGLRPNLRAAWPYYLFAWLWPLLAYAALCVALAFGLQAHKDVSGVIAPALFMSLAGCFVFFGEEFGWRSYLQIRLFSGRPLLAAIATGAIWGVWHYPMVLAGYLGNQRGLGGLLLFPAYPILFSILLGWLRIRTKSIWAPTLAHASNNVFLEAIGAALFVAPFGNSDIFLDPRGLVVLIPLGGLVAWIICSGRLRQVSIASCPLARAP